jgi:hypothetical protein
MILEAGLNAIVTTQWKELRNARSLPLYVACDPFGREVARHPGKWVETAQRLVNERAAKLSKLADFSAILLKVPESAPDAKRLRKATEKIANQTEQIAIQFAITVQFFLGLDEAIGLGDRPGWGAVVIGGQPDRLAEIGEPRKSRGTRRIPPL